MTPEPFEPLDLARTMHATWIDRVHFFASVESTNTAALDWARLHKPDDVQLFVAERQTGGRGRGGNVWWSAPGALTFSVLTTTGGILPKQLPQASLAVGLAIVKTVERFAAGHDVALKWPNDVFLNGRKVAGILIELAASSPRRMAIGVGLNVNNPLAAAPQELRVTATSLIDAQPNKTPLDRTDVLIECLTQIERQLARLTAGEAGLADDWRGYSLLTGRQVRITTPTQVVVGMCESIAADGALVVRTESGVQACYGGIVATYD